MLMGTIYCIVKFIVLYNLLYCTIYCIVQFILRHWLNVDLCPVGISRFLEITL